MDEQQIEQAIYERSRRYTEYDVLKAIKELLAEAIAEEREACAVAAWNHFMDRCKAMGVHPGDIDNGWCAAAAIRARGTQ